MGKPTSLDPVPNSTTILKPVVTKPVTINVSSWNIRRGLIIREQELKDIITQNELNIVFLVETDSTAISTEADFKIQGFKTIVQNKKDAAALTRIICLVDEKMTDEIIIRMDLTSCDFPSLWIEVENSVGVNTICGGLYREWSPGGDNTIEAQVTAMEVFTEQIERATAENKALLIMGDANLCSERWNSPLYKYKRIAEELRETITQCGLIQIDMGPTYFADRLNEDGSEVKSCLDHIYMSESLLPRATTKKLDNTATDHLPIFANFTSTKTSTKKNGGSILKRSMKDFTKTRWLDCLRARNWDGISSQADVHEQTAAITKEINLALDEIAPLKRFKNREHYKPGLTEKARKIMIERDRIRKSMSKSKDCDKPGLKAKYKQLRNRAINQMRIDTLEQNSERISQAKNEGETWKVVNEIMRPNVSIKITIRTPGGEQTEEQDVANSFNKFFVKKISDLKEAIDPAHVKDPLEKIAEKVKNKNLRFSLKSVTTKMVTKIMKQMSKKKSKGNDGISQECLLQGLEVLAAPLTYVINNSIATGVFPDQWKEAIVVPIHKKGDQKEMKNYRPVSCLTAASKVLEKVVCQQLTQFVETHGLLPNSQHGFRAGRSTMTALSAMQKEWIRNTEDGLMTGILIWDLSSAFDTLDVELFLTKLTLYGSDQTTSAWFRSFLTNRTQRVRIGAVVSDPLGLVSGVPQGGILSPIVFTLYTADMEFWLKTSKLTNFADDTTTVNKGKCKLEIKKGLEDDAAVVLDFMASNGLVANKLKTEFLVLNEKDKTNSPLLQIRVGDVLVDRTESAKLLGMMIEESQDWQEHFKQLQSSLNQRLFIIRRIKRQIPKEKLMSVVHSLWVSKLRYGLQLCTKVSITASDRRSAAMKSLQLTQNRMLRALNGSKIKDMISIKSMLSKFNLLSVNQLSAQIKLIEVWKSLNVEGYPLTLDPYNKQERSISAELRPKPTRIFDDTFRLQISNHSFNADAARLWNLAPTSIKTATTLSTAKTAILKHAMALPI